MFHFITPVLAAGKVVETSADATPGAIQGFGNQISDGILFLLGRIPFWISALLLFGASIFVAKLVKKAVENRLSQQIDDEHQEVLILAGRVSYAITLAIGILIALKVAGIDLTQIVAAIALGVGFALRDIIQNFIAGILVLMNKHFAIGDLISVNGQMGKVLEIQTRATILNAIDGTKIIVPNSDMFTSSVINYTSNPMRRVVIPLYVAYGTDLDYAIKVAMHTLKKNPDVLKRPSPSVIIKDYGDSEIDLAARFWAMTKGWAKVRSEMMKEFNRAFTEAGIVIPYNIMHVETAADSAEDEKEAVELEKNTKAKWEAAHEAKEAAETAVVESAPAVAAAPASAIPVANSDASVPAILLPPQPILATVPVVATPVIATAETPIPEATYADYAHIDEITVDNDNPMGT